MLWLVLLVIFDPHFRTIMAPKTQESEKQKALQSVLGQIERNFGKGAIMRLGEASQMQVDTIPTGALTLDQALGGGFPKGRIIEIYGPESSGKTTVALHAVAQVQKSGGVAAFVDASATVVQIPLAAKVVRHKSNG